MEASVSIAFAVAAALIDATRYRIPDWVTFPGVAVAFVLAGLGYGPPFPLVLTSAVGAAAIFGSARFLSGGKLGWGDVKLAAMIAAFLGYGLWVVAMLWALTGAALYFVVYRIHKGSVPERAPFAPFMALGTITVAIHCGGLM